MKNRAEQYRQKVMKKPEKRPHKRMDYRQWANKHFRDPNKALPMIWGTGYNSRSYKPSSTVSRKKIPVFETKWKCYCSFVLERDHQFENMCRDIRKKSFVACPRCTCPMRLIGVKGNIFVIFWAYTKCLFQTLKEKLGKR